MATVTPTFIEVYQNNPDYKEDYKYALELIDIAEKDLAAFEGLYQSKNYSNAIYHLEQATEKITKATLIKIGFAKRKDMREISHNVLKWFVNLLDKAWAKTIGQDLLKDPKYPEKVNAIKKLLEPTEQDAFRQTAETDFYLLLELRKEHHKHVLEKMGNKNFEELQMDVVLEWVFLHKLNPYLYPHESSSRYPDYNLKPKNYSEELGVVKAAPAIASALKQTSTTVKAAILKKYK